MQQHMKSLLSLPGNVATEKLIFYSNLLLNMMNLWVLSLCNISTHVAVTFVFVALDSEACLHLVCCPQSLVTLGEARHKFF